MITPRGLLSKSAPILACIGLLCLWQAASTIMNTDSFPTALEAIRAIPAILGDREALVNIAASLRRMAVGLGLAVAFAIPLGLMMGRIRGVASFCNPLLMVIYPVPKAALMPVIMLWLGVGDLSKTLVIFLGVSLPIIYHSFQGAKAVEEKMLWSGAAMGLSAAQRMIRIVLPAALPEILTGCRTGPLLPPPGQVFLRLAQQLGSGEFLHEIGATLLRLFAGFSIAVIVGVGIGLAAAVNPAINAVVKPVVRVLAPVPKVALYPALLLILGFDHASKITLVAADALFPILLSTYYGASTVEQKLIWSAMAAGTPRLEILFKVVLPAAMPSILTGCRIGLVISCIVVFLAEMIASTDGLGHLLVAAARTFQAVDMFVPLITISLLGLLLNGALEALRAFLLRGFPEV